MLGALGYKLFEAILSEANHSEIDEPELIFETQKASARGMRTNEGFVVMKGSKMSTEIQPINRRYLILRILRMGNR